MSEFEKRDTMVNAAATKVLRDIELVLMHHHCPQGATMAHWIDERLRRLHAVELALETWEEYNAELDALLKAHGWTTGELKLHWIRTQLEQLARTRAPVSSHYVPREVAEPTPVPASAPWPFPVPNLDGPAKADPDPVAGAGGAFDGGGASGNYDTRPCSSEPSSGSDYSSGSDSCSSSDSSSSSSGD